MMASLSKKGLRPSGTISGEQEHGFDAKKNRRECFEDERPSELFVEEGERPSESFGGDGKRPNASCSGEKKRSSTSFVDEIKRPIHRPAESGNMAATPRTVAHNSRHIKTSAQDPCIFFEENRKITQLSRTGKANDLIK